MHGGYYYVCMHLGIKASWMNIPVYIVLSSLRRVYLCMVYINHAQIYPMQINHAQIIYPTQIIYITQISHAQIYPTQTW